MTKLRTAGLLALATAIVGGGAFFAGNASAQQIPTAANVSTAVEKHPEIHRAMRQLNNALTTMQKAADDFHGHKAKAMDLTKGALAELKAALASDRH